MARLWHARVACRSDSGAGEGDEGPASEFFEEQRDAAVFKHGILRRHLSTFVRKAGFGGRPVRYLDAYAGPGSYDDGSPGSPALAGDTARLLADQRELFCHYVERDPDTYLQLVAELEANAPADTWSATCAEAAEALPAVMAEVGDKALFSFFDPFGLGVPLGLLQEHVLDRPKGSPNDVLLNFSLPGLRRNAGKLHLRDGASERSIKAQPKILAGVDAALGGTWWRAIWEQDQVNRERRILNGFVERLTEGDYAAFTVPVSKRWGRAPVYHLIFLSRHPDGMWAFNDNLSLAVADMYAYSHRDRLFAPETVEQLARRYQARIEENLREMLEERARTPLEGELPRIYEGVLGLARSPHLRAAIKALHRAGETATTGVGNLQKMTLERP